MPDLTSEAMDLLRASQAAIARVRALHTSSYETRGVGRYSSRAPHGAYCEHCGDDHPCATIRAIDTATEGDAGGDTTDA